MSLTRIHTREDLAALRPGHDSFVGIDSDGCVFPTMELKQKQCFHGAIVSQWKLEPIERYVRETAEFVNLHSCHRGQNRFPCLLMTFDLLLARPEVKASGVPLPPTRQLRAFVNSGRPLGNPELERLVGETGDPELAAVLQWSQDVNAIVARVVRNVAPFPWVRESLDAIHARSDAICVSQTPTEALVREWDESGLRRYVPVIAGQELGTKAEHLTLAAKGKYPDTRILMIGDALGDLRAARSVGACFYPIDPGHEAASWDRFVHEAYARFLAGTYGGAYEEALVARFTSLLPDTPPWQR